jgi:hypothetical protein
MSAIRSKSRPGRVCNARHSNKANTARKDDELQAAQELSSIRDLCFANEFRPFKAPNELTKVPISGRRVASSGMGPHEIYYGPTGVATVYPEPEPRPRQNGEID